MTTYIAVTVEPPGAPAGTPLFRLSPQIRLLYEFEGDDVKANTSGAYEQALRWVESMGLEDWAVERAVPLDNSDAEGEDDHEDRHSAIYEAAEALVKAPAPALGRPGSPWPYTPFGTALFNLRQAVKTENAAADRHSAEEERREALAWLRRCVEEQRGGYYDVLLALLEEKP